MFVPCFSAIALNLIESKQSAYQDKVHINEDRKASKSIENRLTKNRVLIIFDMWSLGKDGWLFFDTYLE